MRELGSLFVFLRSVCCSACGIGAAVVPVAADKTHPCTCRSVPFCAAYGLWKNKKYQTAAVQTLLRGRWSRKTDFFQEDCIRGGLTQGAGLSLAVYLSFSK